jgi:integrase
MARNNLALAPAESLQRPPCPPQSTCSQPSWASPAILAPRYGRLKTAAKRAGLPSSIGLHTLRHSAAPVMLSAGVPLKVVSEVFGHQRRDHRRHLRARQSRRFAGGVDSAQRRPLVTKSGQKG